MATPINIYTAEQVDGMTRFFRDDRASSGERIYFIQADFTRHLMIQRDSPYFIHKHDDKHIADIVSKFEDSTGIKLPDDFIKGTTIYNVAGLLMDQGTQVPCRVLRQQVFLGGSTFPISPDHTEALLYHTLGNALWNFLDHNVWGDDNSKKNEYRQLRGIELSKNKGKYLKHQSSLFYIASEDFRYLFGTYNAGRNTWYLDQQGIKCPHGEAVSNFWRREIESYGNGGQKEEIQENVQVS